MRHDRQAEARVSKLDRQTSAPIELETRAGHDGDGIAMVRLSPGEATVVARELFAAALEVSLPEGVTGEVNLTIEVPR